MKSVIIVKNTLYLYLRTLVILVIDLITIRFVLSYIGDIDYGIYSVVGGITVLMSFLSSLLSSASVRFFSIDISKDDSEKLNRTFNTFFKLFLFVAIVFVLVCEVIGLWFVNNIMDVPEGRMVAANWVLQLSICSVFFSMMSIPYISMLIAKENVKPYATIDIIRVVVIFLGVIVLKYVTCDRLIMYALVIVFANVIVFTLYNMICRRLHSETEICRIFDKRQCKDIFKYVSWTSIGSFTFVMITQGCNMLLNVFCGTKANTAYSLSKNISNAMQLLSSNMMRATNPQMIKNYVSQEVETLKKIFYFSNKMIVYLNYIVILPLFLSAEYVVSLWLGYIPEFIDNFSRLAMIQAFMLSLQTPISTIAHAANYVKIYHGVVDTFCILTLPVAWIFMKLGAVPEIVYIVNILVLLMAHIIRLFILKKIVEFSIAEYVYKFIIPSSAMIIISAVPFFFVKYEQNLLLLIVSTIYSILVVTGLFYFLVLDKSERSKAKSLIMKTIHYE